MMKGIFRILLIVIIAVCMILDVGGFIGINTRSYAVAVVSLLILNILSNSTRIGFLVSAVTGMLYGLTMIIGNMERVSSALATWMMVFFGMSVGIDFMKKISQFRLRLPKMSIRNKMRVPVLSKSAERMLRVGALSIGFIFFFMTMKYYIQVISIDAPQEYREDMFILTTKRLLDGKSLFTSDSMPNYTNAYGIGYSIAVVPFARIFGSSYVTHKAVAFLFLMLAAGFLFAISLERSNKDFALSFLGVLLIIHQFAHNFFTNGPRPDSLGFLLFLIAILYPARKNYSNLSLLISGLCVVAAFYTKIYFALSFVYVLGYLGITGRFRKMFLYGLYSSVLFAVMAYMVQRYMDFYFFNTLSILSTTIGYVWSHQLRQLIDFSFINGSLIISSAIASIVYFFRTGIKRAVLTQWNTLRSSDHVVEFGLFLSVILVVGKLGGNAGNYLAYYFELIWPFLYLYISTKKKKLNQLTIGLLAINLLYLLMSTSYKVDVSGIRENWMSWKQTLSTYRHIFQAPPFADFVYSRGDVVYDNGHTEYFHVGTPKKNSRINTIANARYSRYIQNIRDSVEQRKFDLIMYWEPYNPGVEPYTGEIREAVENTYTYLGKKEWKTVYGSTYFYLYGASNP